MRRMIRFCATLLLVVVVVLTSRPVWTQESETITVTGLYVGYPPGGEYEEILTPCDAFEVWDVGTRTAAFNSLAQVYVSAKAEGRLSKYGEIVYKPGGTVPDGPWVYLEIIGTNELWVGFSGLYGGGTTKRARQPVQCCQRDTPTTAKPWGRAVRGKGTVTAPANVKASWRAWPTGMKSSKSISRAAAVGCT